MTIPGLRALIALIPLALVTSELAAARDLTFEERMKAQEAIERVYYSHQIGATKPFEEAVPRAVLEDKVRKYLQQTVALDAYWKTPITDEMLQRELERMARGTRLPGRLRELFAALNEDPFLIKECLARATLVDRLTRKFYAFDPTLHAGARQRAGEILRQIEAGDLDPRSDHPDRAVVELIERDEQTVEPGDREREAGLREEEGRPFRRLLSPEEFRKERARWPETPGHAAPLAEEREAFVIRVVLSDTPGKSRVAAYVVPKRSWDLWWESARRDLWDEWVAAVASDGGSPPLAGNRPAGGARSLKPGIDALPDALTEDTVLCADDTWDNGILDDLPDPRGYHTAVWTGSLMVVWGGIGNQYLNSGRRYDPATDTWTPTSTVGAPSTRAIHTAVWTGTVMVVWGGTDGSIPLNTGGRYDPATDSWIATSTVGAPSARSSQTAVWTGTLMVVWGGYDRSNYLYLNTGGRYDPATDSWTATSAMGAPSERAYHTAVWTGTLMVVWGGIGNQYFNTGGRYDPATDSWTPTSTAGAPLGRYDHTAIWTGTLMVVWGGGTYDGYNLYYLNTGGRYDPATDTWTPMSTAGAPSGRYNHTAIWTGTVMVIWGGGYDFAYSYYLNTGGRYDPATDIWTATSTVGAPSARRYHTAVWTGTLTVVWGGYDDSSSLNTGGRYDPPTDTWTPTSIGEAPSTRDLHTAIWTGNVMVIWGGYSQYDYLSYYLNTGGRYDPATDTWAPTSTLGTPPGRYGHTAVWTGSLMIVWGGDGEGYFPLNTGGRYDPATDTWAPTSTLGTPPGRYGHTAVWTGTLTVVWGGYDGSSSLNTGGRYDPDTDTWTPTSTVGAPSARRDHTAVWTGTLMVVWGGYGYSTTYYNTGGRYDPDTDTWTSTSTLGAPSARRNHTAVWTESLMVVWGGYSGSPLNTGGRYDPALDTWTPTSTVEATSWRRYHTAVWTGTLMVVWGGIGSTDLNTGGRYNPATDTWTPTSTLGAPSERAYHTAIWMGDLMVIWGGYDGIQYLETGGRYVIDNDGDGFSGCQGDCDDSAATVYPGAPQICDGLNNDCSDPSWPTDPADEADADDDGFRICAGDCNDSASTIYPGAPQICDGVNNDCSDPSWPTVPADEIDGDGDGHLTCDDCNDASLAIYPGAPQLCDGINNDCTAPAWPAVPADEVDADTDGFRICAGDCDDSGATVYPGAPQICDGINNDCSFPGWPALAGTNESDDDGDTFTECLADCDDGSAATYSGAAEINDGRDNQCPSDPGYGIADEISGALAFSNPEDPGEISWPAQSGATTYEVVRSTSPLFPPVCSGQFTQIPSWSDPAVPAQGSAFFYLVRPIGPNVGSWGQRSSGVERVGLCGAESNCNDGVDDDSDGQTDCDDPDCFQDPACAPATFTFTDTLGDDIAPEALYDFLSGLSVAATDYILFSISGPDVTDFKWCAERADFYRDSYLALAMTGGVAYSGAWNHWSLLEGGSWVGPDTTGYPNYYSADCWESHAWCAEFGLAGRYAAISPEETGECEAADFSIGCGSGSWVLTIQIGPSRLGTCGF